MQTLPRTKFCPPQPHREVIRRSQWIDWLRGELPPSRLVLLAAPAGYGKTTLLSALPEALPAFRLGWFALDGEDNDLVRFLSGLGEALANIHPELKQTLTGQVAANAGLLGRAGAAFPVQQSMALLVNAVVNLPAPPGILVLDDLHEIANPAVYAALDYLLDKLPEQLHLVIATRHEPPLRLSQLRARRQLAELTAAQLAFDVQESGRFLNELLRLELSPADLLALQRKTEGWPVGLVLLTGRLRSLPPHHDRAAFLRHLEPLDAHTFHYLADEVLAHQPEELRTFLLETSVLNELNPALCQQLTGRTDAAALLAELYRRNLFLTLAGEAGGAIYRYHALFADFLQRELKRNDADRWRALHRLAAGVEKTPGRAIAHLLAAGEWLAASEQIEANGELFLQQGLQETVSAWIQALPAECIEQRGQLLYLQGLASLLRGDLERARPSLERSLRLPGAEIDAARRGRLLVGLASLAFVRADFSGSADLLRQAEPYSRGIQERVDFLMLRASLALFYESDWRRAGEDLQEALQLVQASDDMRQWFMFALYLAPEFTVLPGMLDLLERFCEAARLHYGEQATPLRLGVEDTWACIHLRRGRPEQAIACGADALAVKEQLGGYPFLGMNAALAAAAACVAGDDLTSAGAYLEKAVQQVQTAELNRALSGGGLYPLGRLYWLQGRYAEARQVCQQMAALPVRLPLVEVLQRMLAGLLEMAAGRHTPAEALLAEAVRLQSKEWVSEIYGSARLLLAYSYHLRQDTNEALYHFNNVLARCEQNRTPGVILQERFFAVPLLRLALKKGQRPAQAAALLAQLGAAAEDAAPPAAPITGRQMEILRLIAAGYSNQAIADALTLSLATVKSHVVHIMDRLGASSRMEAVARARDEGLL